MTLHRIIFPKVHRGLTIITWATAVRWMAWGLVDGLLAIFLFSFADSYAGSGVLSGIYSIVFILVVPIVGALANHVRAKNLILSGLIIYPFIGLSYYLAGLWGMVIFVIIARALNGISYALDNVGRTTYLRKHHNREVVGSAFGYMITLANFWWIAALLAGMVVVRYMEIHEMFLFIIPTSLIALWMVTYVPKDLKDNKGDDNWGRFLTWKTYKNFLQELVLWSNSLKKIAVLSFFLGIATSAVSFLMPILLFQGSGSMQQVILFVFISSVPMLFSSAFGWLADRAKPSHLTLSFILLAILLILLGLTTVFSLQLLLVFLFMAVSIFISLFIDVEMTRRGDARRYGTLASAVLEVGEFSSMLGPILVGYLIDLYNASFAFVLMAIVIILVATLSKPAHRELIKTM